MTDEKINTSADELLSMIGVRELQVRKLTQANEALKVQVAELMERNTDLQKANSELAANNCETVADLR